MHYDEIVVGSGAGGAVVATRLSEDPARSVLLIEAGPDYPTIADLPADLKDPWISLADHDWKYTASYRPGRELPYPRGRTIGGSTSVNAAAAMRGSPADFDDWVDLGNDEWGYDAVLPYYRKLETQAGADVDALLHGTDGPIWIEYAERANWDLAGQMFCRAVSRHGVPIVAEHNAGTSRAVGPISHNVRDGLRVSTAVGYLAAARARPNLTIRPGCLVDRVAFTGDRATGVEVISDGRRDSIAGGRVTLAAGAIGTPAILLRSGVGAADAVRSLGLDVVLDAPAVGTNLKDHQAVFMTALAAPDVPQDPARYFEFYYRDRRTYIALLTLFAERPLGVFFGDPSSPPVIALAPAVARPLSSGTVSLSSADPSADPRIDLNFLSEQADIQALTGAVQMSWGLLHSPELGPLVKTILPPVADIVGDKMAMRDWMLSTCGTGFHPVGTCRMGPAGSGAVVDQRGRVHGVDGLRIADASVMPDLVTSPVNLTCIMIGERIADWMRAEDR
jgi:choline dehydrogenase